MNEVSCKVLWLHLEVAKQFEFDPEQLVAGLPTTLAHIRSPNERVDWATYCALAVRLEELVGGPAEIERVSGTFIQLPGVKGIRAMLGTVTGPRALFAAIHRWFGTAMFTIVESSMADLGPNEIQLELRIPEAFADSPQFFRVNAGVFRANPRILGLPDAHVEYSLRPRVATYRIRMPPSMAIWARVRRAMQGLLSARATFEELGAQQLEIKQKYFQLEAANTAIEGERNTVLLLLEVSQAAHEARSLDEVVKSITEQLTRRMRVSGARTEVNVERDGLTVAAAFDEGALDGEGAVVRQFPLLHADAELGRVIIATAGRMMTDDEVKLVTRIVDVVGNAIESAVSFEVIRSYRNSLEAKVATRTAELREANERVQRNLDSRNRFFANVNHELRTPLSVIMLATDQLAGNLAITGAARENLETARANTERLRNLVDELLLLAAGAEDKRNMRLASFGAGRMVEDLVSSVKPLANKKGLQLMHSVEPSLVVEGDARLVERALVNLVTNAIKYTDEGLVEVSVTTEGPEVIFAVKDSGPGIASDYLPRVFDRFFQVPFGPGKPGNGIGLALVKEIALQHEGSVSVDSSPGQGSTFRIRVPRRASDAVRARSEQMPTSPGKPGWASGQTPIEAPARDATDEVIARPAPPRSQHRVLVVEDDADLLRQLTATFESKGWTVDSVNNAEDALARAQSYPPDLLISDVDLGAGMNGLELVKAFRALKDHHNAPAIVLTANPTYGVDDAFDHGAVEYLEKPIKPGELVARVRGLLAYRDMHTRMLATERLAAQGTVLAGLSHELRNPLNGLINAIDPLRTMLPEDAVQKGTAAGELLSVIEECGQRVSKLSGELLLLTRTDGAKYERYALTEVLERALRATSHKLRLVELKKQIAFEGEVRCSPLQLSQVLINLIENAVDAAGVGGWVLLSSTAADDRVVVEVRDSGPGVPRELRARIFEPFFTTKAAGKGTGLGLAIARDIARRHGGDLELTEEGAFGVRLWLPTGSSPAADSLAAVSGALRS